MHRHLHLAFLAGLNVLVAFLSQVVIYTRIGPSVETDAFIAAATVPQMLAGMFSVSLASVLVPLFSGEDQARQRDDSASVLVIIGGLFMGAAALLFVSAQWWVSWLFPGFEGRTEELCVSLVRIQLFSMAFMAMSSVITAVLYARGQFVRVEVITLAVVTFSLVVLYAALPPFGIHAAAWVALLRAFLMLVIFLPAIGWPAQVSIRTPRVTEAWSRLKPILAGNAYYKTDVLVDRYLVSMGNAGELSLLGFAQQLYAAASGIIGKVWGGTAIPRLAMLAKAGDDKGFRHFYRRRLGLLLGLPLAGYLLLLAAGESGLGMFLGHGRVTAADVHLLWQLMALLGGVFVFGCAGVIVSGAYYAIGDTRTPSYLSVGTFTVLIIAKILAFRWFGVVGICLVASGYYLVNAALLHIMLPGKLHASHATGNL